MRLATETEKGGEETGEESETGDDPNKGSNNPDDEPV